MNQKPIEVLFFLPTAGGGGAEMHVIRLINHIGRSRFRPKLALLRAGGAYEKHLKKDVPVKVLCPEWVRSSTVSCLIGSRPLKLLIQREKPEIVFSALPNTHAVLARALAGIENPPKIVLGVQNNVGVTRLSKKSVIRQWESNWSDRAYNLADSIVAISKGVAADFEQHFNEVNGRVDIAYNIGCDEKVFDAAEEALSSWERPPGLLLVACGRLEEQKDYPTLLKAVRIVRETTPLTLWILGRGSLEAELRKKIEDLGLEDSVELLGFQANPFAFMAAADIFILSSAWEGFGNVVVEAMACGTPVVSTRCPFGPEEILAGGEYGLMADVGDSKDLAERILELVEDSERRADLAEKGRIRARDFLPHGITRQYENIFLAAL
ncbi:glycosyltransferase [Akkermansiaceae bacterium]|nr:glycosyltransferase [Akkermansiaceae bacterium]